MNAIRSFSSKLEELDIWTKGSGLHFVDANRDFGNTYESSRKFLDVHQELLNQVHMKCFELEGLKGALKTITDSCPNDEVKNLQDLICKLHAKLQTLKKLLDIRITIAEKYTKFHKLCNQLTKEMEHLENQLTTTTITKESKFEDSRLLIQQLYLQVYNLGKNTMEDVQKMYDEFIDKSSTIECIQSIINKLNEKQSQIIDMWKKLDSKFKEGKKVDEEWLGVVKDANEAILTLKEVDSQLFPILNDADNSTAAKTLNELEERMAKLPKVKVLPQRLGQMISNVEEVSQKLSKDKKENGQRLVKDLRLVHSNLQVEIQKS